jgi:cysteine-rich repeat protein
MTTTTRSSHVARLALGALFVSALAGPAGAQCAGDCNGDGTVAINELIIGVNIALGSAPVSNCPSFDVSGDGTVAINELITAVNNALNGCTAVSPTPTATPTNSVTVTPVPTSDICAQPSTSCGDGVPDVLSKTETCDDHNTIDDDGCPSDCCVTPCTLMQDRPLRVKVNFASVDPEVFLTSLNLFIRYEDGVVDVAGVNDDPAVLASVTSDIFATTPRDFNYGLNLLLEDPSLVGYTDGTAAIIEFRVCDAAAQAPPLSSFTCTVREGGDANFNVIPGDQITCTLAPAE